MSMKVMLSMPEHFLKEIDRQAREEHRTRSELLREAARQYLDRSRPSKRPIDDPKIRDAFESLDELRSQWSGRWDSATVIREMREGRYGRE